VVNQHTGDARTHSPKRLSVCLSAGAQAVVSQHTGDARWGGHAQAILSGAMWKPPQGGGSNDGAHPPIYPTRYSAGESGWDPHKARLYEFIVRSFLA
jgi:DNA topoisomerase III